MRAKILVVDDEQDMLELLGYHLREQGYEVLVASTGWQAIEQARKHLPDMVLLDLMLEGMDGYTVCEVLRQIPPTAAIPVLMVTALAGQIARFNGLAAGAQDFIRKPFDVKELMRKVERTLQVRIHPASTPSPTAEEMQGAKPH